MEHEANSDGDGSPSGKTKSSATRESKKKDESSTLTEVDIELSLEAEGTFNGDGQMEPLEILPEATTSDPTDFVPSEPKLATDSVSVTQKPLAEEPMNGTETETLPAPATPAAKGFASRFRRSTNPSTPDTPCRTSSPALFPPSPRIQPESPLPDIFPQPQIHSQLHSNGSTLFHRPLANGSRKPLDGSDLSDVIEIDLPCDTRQSYSSQDVRLQPPLSSPPRLAGLAKSMDFRSKNFRNRYAPSGESAGDEGNGSIRDVRMMSGNGVGGGGGSGVESPIVTEAVVVPAATGDIMPKIGRFTRLAKPTLPDLPDAPSLPEIPTPTTVLADIIPKPGRFTRLANPTLPILSPKPPVVSGPIDLGPYTEVFQPGYLPNKLKFFDSHTHVCFALNKLESAGVSSYAAMRRKFPEIFPDSYGGAVQVFCHPQYLRQPDWWDGRMIDGSEGDLHLSYGLHPNWAEQWADEGVRKGLEECLRRGKMRGRLVAMGEIGLDYNGEKHTEEKRQLQKKALLEQLDWARRENLPVVIHCRGDGSSNQADLDCLELCKERLERYQKIHRHCFTGSLECAEMWRKHFPNIVFGFTPPKGGRRMPAFDAIKELPLTACLLETDAPYFVPNGMTNFPAGYSSNRVAIPGGLALVTAVEIAKIHNTSVAAVIEQTNDAVHHIYGIRVA